MLPQAGPCQLEIRQRINPSPGEVKPKREHREASEEEPVEKAISVGQLGKGNEHQADAEIEQKNAGNIIVSIEEHCASIGLEGVEMHRGKDGPGRRAKVRPMMVGKGAALAHRVDAEAC